MYVHVVAELHDIANVVIPVPFSAVLGDFSRNVTKMVSRTCIGVQVPPC